MGARMGTGSDHVVGGERRSAARQGRRAAGVPRRLPFSRAFLTVALAALGLTLLSTSSPGQGSATGTPNMFEVKEDDFAVTRFGIDGNTNLAVYEPSMAYNSRDNEFLVVWDGDKTSDGDHEIWGRRIDAVSGRLIGTDCFQISEMSYDADVPDVAYNAANDEYLVVWQGAETFGDTDIFGQRLDAATGAEVGDNDFRISNMSLSGVGPSVALNTQDDEYLVVWQGSDGTEIEIYGQRLTAATGAEVGDDDFRISAMGTDGLSAYKAIHVEVAYNSTDNNFLAVWEADDDTGSLIDDEYEIYGQLISAAGADIETDDMRLSDMYTDGTHYDAVEPAVTFNSRRDEYLVVWSGYDDTPPADGASEIFGQRVAGSTGAEVGTNDFPISDTGVPGEFLRYATLPEVAYDPINDLYLVVWRGDDDASGCGDGEYEMHGQFLAGETGADILLNDFRFSTMGNDVHTGSFSTDWLAPLQSVVAYGSVENEWLVAWRSDNELPGLVRAEWELYGQFLDAGLMELIIADERGLEVRGLGGR